MRADSEERAAKGATRSVYPVHHDALPPGTLSTGRYLLRFASGPEDLEAIQRLRFEVFNLELDEGLDSAFETGRDEDEFDAVCHHLMVFERKSNAIVGTYRVMIEPMALSRGGFYSESEFDFTGLPDSVRFRGVEIGRVCVAQEHRNGRVIHLLWRGLARYLDWNQKRFLFGCCSVPTTDEGAAWALHQRLQSEAQFHKEVRIEPLPELRCAESAAPQAPAEIPPIFASYLSFGARVCSAPAIDRAFKVVDFFVIFDLEDLEPRARRSFFDSGRWKIDQAS
ncbi:MAG: GNAT family N-acyltransferase [Myxococcota bacterium]